MSCRSAPDRFAVAGLSMGGYCALEIVRQAPERVLGWRWWTRRRDPIRRRAGRTARSRSSARGPITQRSSPSCCPEVDPSVAAARRGGRCGRARHGARRRPEIFTRQQRAIMSRADSRPLLERDPLPDRRRLRSRRCADADGDPRGARAAASRARRWRSSTAAVTWRRSSVPPRSATPCDAGCAGSTDAPARGDPERTRVAPL